MTDPYYKDEPGFDSPAPSLLAEIEAETQAREAAGVVEFWAAVGEQEKGRAA